MALYDKDGYKFSGHKAGCMIAKRFDEQPQNEFPWVGDILGSDWIPEGYKMTTRSAYRQLCIERACQVYDPSAQYC